jgi:hypothetical protein
VPFLLRALDDLIALIISAPAGFTAMNAPCPIRFAVESEQVLFFSLSAVFG